MAHLKQLESLKIKLGDSKDVADAISDLIAFAAIMVTGTTISGGVLTIPILLATSAKTTAALSKLAAALIPRAKDKGVGEDLSEKVDEIFYVLAQKSYLHSLEKHLGGLPPDLVLQQEKHQPLLSELMTAVAVPSEAEARFQFGWTPEGGPLELYKSYTAYVGPLLVAFGIEKKKVLALLSRIERDARRDLFRELTARKKNRQWLVEYQLLQGNASILEALQAFGSHAESRLTVAWESYLQALKMRPTSPIWGEEKQLISISQLFVEPDYAYFQQISSGSGEQPRPIKGVRLEIFLSGLLSARRPSTELIFIMGGPGVGKTSLMDIFCAKLADAAKVHLILVQAKRLDPAKAVLPEVQSYLRDFGHGAVADSIGAASDVVIVIDGFDELAQATRNSLEAFFRNSHDLVKERAASRLRIILTGRPTLFTENDVAIPAGSHVITVLPFDRPRVEQWSHNWQVAAGGTFDGTKYFDSQYNADIREIAAQPMLLYLLARMYEAGQAVPVEFTNAAGSARFQIYRRILDWICRRQAGKGVVKGDVNLRRFLQVAGLAAFQSGQRVLHWEELQKSLLESGLSTNQPEEQKQKAYSTILSFAFTSIDQKSWEFTHKSFGEALAAEAFGLALEDISEEGRHGEMWRLALPDAARKFVSYFGPQFLSEEILSFLVGWAEQIGEISRCHLLERLIELLPQILGSASSNATSAVAIVRDMPVFAVCGKAARSWFALANLVLSFNCDLDVGGVCRRSGLNAEVFREAALLCHLVSPIQIGEYARLFSRTRRLIYREKAKSRPYVQRIMRTLRDIRASKEHRLEVIPPDTVFLEDDFVRSINFAGNELTYRTVWHDFNYQLRDARNAPIETSFARLEEAIADGFEESPIARVEEELPGSASPEGVEAGLVKLLEEANSKENG